MSLPGERLVKRAIRRILADELAECKDLLQFGLDVRDPAIINRRRLKADTVTVVMGLFTQACVWYRAIIHLCEAGLDRSAAPVSRSLFETFLNLTFLVRRRVALHRFDFHNRAKKPLDLFGKKLHTQFRTDLYCAYCMLRSQMMVGQWPKTPGLKRTGKAACRKLSTVPQSYMVALGPAWAKRLRKNANTCVGLSIADYAASVGKSFYMLYRSVYAMDSQSVHPSDPLAYLEVDEGMDNISPRWHTTPEDVRWMLHQSSIMFLGSIEELNKRFRFGEDTTQRVEEFAASLKKWKIG